LRLTLHGSFPQIAQVQVRISLGISLPWLSFGVNRSCEVAIIWPDYTVLKPKGDTWKVTFPIEKLPPQTTMGPFFVWPTYLSATLRRFQPALHWHWLVRKGLGRWAKKRLKAMGKNFRKMVLSNKYKGYDGLKKASYIFTNLDCLK